MYEKVSQIVLWSRHINFLVDHLEAEVFADGSVTLGKLCSKILERKGSVWVARCADIKTADGHELVVLLWVNHVIAVH